MGFFSKQPDMARETSPTTSANGDAAAEPARPGTSGTEMLLVNNRRRASHRLKEASRKERDYKTKKRSASARANYNEAVRRENTHLSSFFLISLFPREIVAFPVPKTNLDICGLENAFPPGPAPQLGRCQAHLGRYRVCRLPLP